MIDKKQLVRIVRTPEGAFKLDESGKAAGRGAYLCKTADCLAKAAKSKAFERSFKSKVPQEIYDIIGGAFSE